MDLITASIMALAIGLTVGFNIKRLRKNQSQIDSNSDIGKETKSKLKHENHNLAIHFDTLEIRF
jgi:uncharacterized membrane-anchored protein YhcB (DUF1043 family)